MVASGNNGQSGKPGSSPRMSSPACISTAVSVGATTGTGSLASYSNLTAATTILAPGSNVTSSIPPSGFGVLSGTSMATPMVTAAVAALREKAPSITVDAAIADLQSSGDTITTYPAVGDMPEVQLDAALALQVGSVPSSPQDVVLTPGDSQISVSWSAPAFLGAGFSGYAVTTSPASPGCTTSSTSCVVGGLTNGTTYRVSVTAVNGAGSSGARVRSGAAPDRPGPAGVGDRVARSGPGGRELGRAGI